jgi:hypothetical protein
MKNFFYALLFFLSMPSPLPGRAPSTSKLAAVATLLVLGTFTTVLAAPSPDWMSRCCGDRKLKELYLPGTHDAGTGHPWTLPQDLPFWMEWAANIAFNLLSDFARAQRLSIYSQLQAGSRYLDLRLAVNPWLKRQNPQAPLENTIVVAHSLPGAPLAVVLADVARFLREQPSEVGPLAFARSKRQKQGRR